MVELFKVLGDLNRLRLINLLLGHSICVCEMEVILELTQSNVSRHLTKLKSIGALTSDKDAQWIHYSVSDDFINSNKLLMEHLKSEFENKDIYIRDLQRLALYVQKELTCQHITVDREHVLYELKLGNEEDKYVGA